MVILRKNRWSAAFLLGSIFTAVAGIGCGLFVDTDVALGLGSPCKADSDCHASACVQGICSLPCSDPGGCGGGSVTNGSGGAAGAEGTGGAALTCSPDGNALCVGVLFRDDPAVPSGNSWSKNHADGIRDASAGRSNLIVIPKVTKGDPVEVGDTENKIRDLIGAGCKVIISTSPSMTASMDRSARLPENAGITYLSCGGRKTSDNHLSYFGQMYKAAYFAGYLAALRSATHTVGMIGSVVTPTVVAYINAFALGANAANAETKLKVSWLNNWRDESLERKIEGITEAFPAGGSDVIAYQVDDTKPVTLANMRTPPPAIIGNDDVHACPEGGANCLGVTRWNWGPLYKQLFDMVQGQSTMLHGLVKAPFALDDPQGVAAFDLTSAFQSSTNADDPQVLSAYRTKFNEIKGRGEAWSPFENQCFKNREHLCVAAESSIDDEHLLRMCWFAESPKIVDINGVAADVPKQQDCAEDSP